MNIELPVPDALISSVSIIVGDQNPERLSIEATHLSDHDTQLAGVRLVNSYGEQLADFSFSDWKQIIAIVKFLHQMQNQFDSEPPIEWDVF